MTNERIAKCLELQATLHKLHDLQDHLARIQSQIITMEHRRNRLRFELQRLAAKEEDD